MWREIAKQTLGVIVGGVIGGLVAFFIKGPFWWLGLISGGIIGYFAGEPRELIQGFKVAKRCFIHLKPVDRPWYRLGIGIIGSLWVLAGGIVFSLHFSSTPVHLEANIAIIVFGTLFGMSYILPALYIKNLKKDYVPFMAHESKKIGWINWLLLLLHIPFIFTVVAVFVIWKFFSDVLLLFFKALWRFIRYIHSKKRVLRLIDSTLVASIAWGVGGNVFQIVSAGVFAGLIITPIHFYLISVKLLGVVPNGIKSS